jgi:hypothetical protein
MQWDDPCDNAKTRSRNFDAICNREADKPPVATVRVCGNAG